MDTLGDETIELRVARAAEAARLKALDAEDALRPALLALSGLSCFDWPRTSVSGSANAASLYAGCGKAGGGALGGFAALGIGGGCGCGALHSSSARDDAFDDGWGLRAWLGPSSSGRSDQHDFAVADGAEAPFTT